MRMADIPFVPRKSAVRQVKFGGYVHLSSAGEGDIYDMKNIGGDEYPVLTPRRRRLAYQCVPTGADDFIFGTGGELYYIAEGKFYANGAEIGATASKRMCLLGNEYVIVSEPGLAVYRISDGTFSTTSSGERQAEIAAVSTTTPGSTTVTDHIKFSWTGDDPDDTSGPHTLIITYDATGATDAVNFYDTVADYFSQSGTYAFAGPYITVNNFKEYVNGITHDSGQKTITLTVTHYTVMEYSGQSSVTVHLDRAYPFQPTSVTISESSSTSTGSATTTWKVRVQVSGTTVTVTSGDAANDDAVNAFGATAATMTGKIVKIGAEEQTLSSASTTTVNSRKEVTMTVGSAFTVSGDVGIVSIYDPSPNIEFPETLENVFSSNNRLWGTHGNTIYASKLGSPYEWYTYDGISTDSYSVDVGSVGEFTAGFEYAGHPRFFKEHSVITVYGGTPDEFSLSETTLLGVSAGSRRSLCVVGGYVYYLSEQGVCRWGGGAAAVVISDNFGAYLSGGVAGSDGRRYYISLDSDGERGMYVYDTATGLWHKEDAFAATDMRLYGRNLYALGADGCYIISGDVGSSTETFSSAVEFADFYDGTTDEKTVSKIQMRVEIDDGAVMFIKIKYDGGEWEHAGIINATKKRVWDIPIIPRRCDHFRIKIECDGYFRLYSLTRHVMT